MGLGMGVFIGEIEGEGEIDGVTSSSPFSIIIGAMLGVGVGKFTGPISIILFVDGRYKIARFAPVKIKTLSPFWAFEKKGWPERLFTSVTVATVGTSSGRSVNFLTLSITLLASSVFWESDPNIFLAFPAISWYLK